MADIVGIDKSLRVPGRLAADPTAIGTFPHGGTDLGEALRIEFMPQQSTRPIVAEDLGGENLDRIIRFQQGRLVCVMRGFPTEMMKRVWPASSGSGATAVVSYPGASAADKGYRASTRSLKLLFSPEDTTNHLALVFFEAIVLFEETAAMQMMVTEELGLAVVFEALRRTSDGKSVEIARLGSISL